MKDPGDNSQSRRHSLSDWLALHELDPTACRRILDAITHEAAGEIPDSKSLDSDFQPPDPEVAWLRTAQALRAFLSKQQSIIDDTFEKTAKILVDERDKSPRGLTLDNGQAAYPTILFSYRSEPSDSLIIAHEFGHALQIRASRGKFVPPVIREVCAFLGEGALLAHTRQRDEVEYAYLVRAWRADNVRYFGLQRDRLQAALSQPEAPYKYSWNYPIARYLAMQISEGCSRDWIWSIFEGETSVRGVLRELRFSLRQYNH